MKKVFTKLMSLSIVALLLNSCYIKEDIPFVPPVVENPTEYVVTIYTVDASNNNAPMDIALPLFGINSSQVTRVGTGVYEFKPTSAGTFSFKASKSGYYDAFANVTLPKGSVNEVINSSVIVSLTKETTPETPDPAKYTLWGRVTNGVDNSNLNPTTVTCTLRGKVVTCDITVTNNLFKIEFPEPGVYDITVNAAGYESVTLTQNISKIEDGQEFISELTVPMYMIGTYQGQTYSIRGTVMNINHVVQLGAQMATQIDGVSHVETLPNGTYEVLGLKNTQDVSFVFSADSCYSSAFQLSISQFSGTPSIVYDVFLKPVPAGSAIQTEIITPDPTTGSVGSSPIIITTPNAALLENQPTPMHTSFTIPANSILTNASNQTFSSPVAFWGSTTSQFAPALTVSGSSPLGISLFEVGIQPTAITSSNPMTVSITNPFGSLEVDDSYLASNSYATTTKGILPMFPLTFDAQSATLNTQITSTGNYVGVTRPINNAVILDSIINDGSYTEDFYNRTGQSLSNVKYEYYAKTGNVYESGYSPTELINSSGIYFLSLREQLFLLSYIYKAVEMQLGTTSSSLPSVKTTRETGVSCASNQYMKTTTSYQYTIRKAFVTVKDSHGTTTNLVIKVRNYTTTSSYDLDVYNSSHQTGSHITNNGAGGGYGSSNL